MARIATEPFAASSVSGTSDSRLQVDLGQHDMDVRVDQARHQRAAAEVDARGAGGGDRTVGDVLDHAVFDQDRYAILQFVAARVQEASAAEHVAGHMRISPRWQEIVAPGGRYLPNLNQCPVPSALRRSVAFTGPACRWVHVPVMAGASNSPTVDSSRSASAGWSGGQMIGLCHGPPRRIDYSLDRVCDLVAQCCWTAAATMRSTGSSSMI